jgi:glucarate dehydratase
MVHLAAVTPNLTYACDTHWPWKTEDVVARLHEQYLRCGLRNRDDTGYMGRVVPGYGRRQPRW